MVKWHILLSSFFDSFFGYINQGLVKTLVDVSSKVELLPYRLQHSFLFVLINSRLVRLIWAVALFLDLANLVIRRSDFSKPVLLLTNAFFGDVNFVNGFRSWVVNLTCNRGLSDTITLFVDKFYEHTALLIGDF